MKSFKNFLLEQAIWKDSLIMSSSGLKMLDLDIKKEGLENNYSDLGKYKNYNFGCLFIQSKGILFKVYNFNLNGVIKAFLRFKITGFDIKGIPVLEVDLAQKGDISERGLVRIIYDYVLDNNIIISDYSQTPDSAKIWVDLSKKYNVYLFNIRTKEILEELTDLKLKDERVWNNDRDIRMLCIKR